jgi:NADPH:quinone reductase-like Zn-dependent oxidoreductase
VAAVTAWHAVEVRGKVRPGQTVVIQGTGGVSLFALQFVLALGARPIVVSRNGSKLERLRQLGVEDLIEYSDTSGWEDQVLSRTRGRGVDHVIEIIGGESLNRSLRAVRISGTICFIGLIAGLSAPINTYEFVTRNVHLHGIETGSRAMFEEMNHFIEEHELRPVIDQVYPFDDARSALSRLESGSHLGKLVVAIP